MAMVRRAVGGVAQGEAEMQAHELARSRPKKKGQLGIERSSVVYSKHTALG